MSSSLKKSLPMTPRFVISGLAGMGATCIVQPFDYIRIRCQSKYFLSSTPHTIEIVHGMGVKAKKLGFVEGALKVARESPSLLYFYQGISAGLFRQATYTTARLGMYIVLEEKLQQHRKGKPLTFLHRLGLGLFTGGTGAFVFETPSVICLNRMMGDRILPVAERRNYKHVFDALIRITKEEGFLSLWKGCVPSVYRACALNAAQLGVYSQAKVWLLKTGKFKDNIFLHAPASIVSGVACTVSSLPFDLVRTRVQMETMKGVKTSVPRELVNIVKAEGITSLWKGFFPFFSRLAPHTIICFLFFEKLSKLYLKTRMKLPADKL